MKIPAKGTIVLLILWIGIMVLTLLVMSPSEPPTDNPLGAVLRPDPRPLKSFALVDQHNQPFTIDQLAGRWSFVFFGYTYCPDICPTTLTILVSLYAELEKQGFGPDEYQIVFVSVDPERDSPEHIANYLAFFDNRLIGATGEPDALLAFAKQFGAMFFKEEANSDGNYLVAHTGSIFLTSPRATVTAAFSPPHQPRSIADLFQQIVRAH